MDMESMRRNRKAYDIGRDISRLGRLAYIKAVKGMGFYDVCECYGNDDFQSIPMRVRPGTGIIGQKECPVCENLLWPMSSIYACDRCSEPTLSEEYPLSESEDFLCQDCIE